MNAPDPLGRIELTADALVSGLDRFPQELAYLYTALDYLHIAAADECQITPSNEDRKRDSANSVWVERVGFGPLLLDVCAAERSIAERASRTVIDVGQCTEMLFPNEWSRVAARLSGARDSWRQGTESAVFGITREAPEFTQTLALEVTSAVAEFRTDIRRAAPQIELFITYAAAPGNYFLAAGSARALSGPSKRPHRAVLRAFETGLVGWSVNGGTTMFAVPCIVGSVPWAIAAIELGPNEWRTAYSLYRDVLPRTLERVRATVRLLYIRTVIEVVDTELAHDVFDPARLNRSWHEAAASFPFRVPQIHAVGKPETHDDAIDLRGGRWVVRPDANPFFPSRIGDAEGASWGDLEELEQLLTTSLRSRFELGQRDRREAERDAARRQGEAWAHEVKNYTGPVIRLLARVARDCPSRHPNIDWALQGSRILNAVSYAIQLGIGQMYRGGIAATRLRRLPRSTAAEIVEAVLQYLLNYHDASTGDQLVLEWCPRWSPEDCIRRLSSLLSARGCMTDRDVDWEVLTRAEVVWTVALLRELIQNVRINHPVAGDVKVGISYRLGVQGDDLVLELTQKQREMTVEEGPEEPPGIRHANELFGRASGIGLGEIEILPCEVDEPGGASLSGGVGGWAGKAVTYRARARLALDAKIAR